jgi:hypothetical protein
MEKTALVFRSRFSQQQSTKRLVNPEQFMAHLADGSLEARLADSLIGPSPDNKDSSMRVYHLFAKEEADEWVCFPLIREKLFFYPVLKFNKNFIESIISYIASYTPIAGALIYNFQLHLWNVWPRRAKTHEDYKSVFCTLYRLTTKAREKFDVMSLEETRTIDWPELREKIRNGCEQRATYSAEMTGWSVDRVDEVFFQLLSIFSVSSCVDS